MSPQRLVQWTGVQRPGSRRGYVELTKGVVSNEVVIRTTEGKEIAVGIDELIEAIQPLISRKVSVEPYKPTHRWIMKREKVRT